MSKLVSAFAVAALALVGCSAGGSAAESSTPVETSQAAAAPTIEPSPTANPAQAPSEPRQKWADKQINLFLNGNSKSVFADFNPDIAHHHITDWSSPMPGVIELHVSGNEWERCDLEFLGSTMIRTAGWESTEMKLVLVESENLSVEIDRISEPAFPGSCS